MDRWYFLFLNYYVEVGLGHLISYKMQFDVFWWMCVSPSAVLNCLRGSISYKALRCTISLQITPPLISTWERCCICRSECYSCAHGFAILMMNSSSLTVPCHILKRGNFDFDLFSVSDILLSVIKRCFLSTASLKCCFRGNWCTWLNVKVWGGMWWQERIMKNWLWIFWITHWTYRDHVGSLSHMRFHQSENYCLNRRHEFYLPFKINIRLMPTDRISL